MFKTSELFGELASETRLTILLMLEDKPRRLKDLANKLGLTVQEVHRNISRLLDASLIAKNSDGEFELTEYGLLIVKQIPYFRFLSNNKQLFIKHTLNYLPEKFVQRIGALTDARVYHSLPVVLEKIKMLESNARKSLKLLIGQVWYEEGVILADKINNNVEVTILLREGIIFPKEIIESDMIKSIEELTTRDNFNTRMVERNGAALYINEEEAAVIFPEKNGEFDMSHILISNNKIFYEWCLDLFNHYLQNSKPYMPDKIKIV
ncbi:MAG: hypothetical protein KatS3mg003_1374 [Candidatus Nitrosocaldaceae archaeon]|nr:MAG: hypothetical protein KatS3mg003_1374 [Candidatus Nitrosocaldaceae archaeon]